MSGDDMGQPVMSQACVTSERAYCTRPYDQGGLIHLYIKKRLLMKGLDSTYVCYIVDYSFLESNRAVIINLCDLVWTVVL